MPISVVESPEFREFLVLLNPTMATLLPHADSTLMRWIVEAFQENLGGIRTRLLCEAISKIHLSADLWTSPSHQGLVAVVAHFVDSDFKLRTRLIALRIVNGKHSGKNLGWHLRRVITDFSLKNTLGWLTFDNDSTNDKALRLCLRELFNLTAVEAEK